MSRRIMHDENPNKLQQNIPLRGCTHLLPRKRARALYIGQPYGHHRLQTNMQHEIDDGGFVVALFAFHFDRDDAHHPTTCESLPRRKTARTVIASALSRTDSRFATQTQPRTRDVTDFRSRLRCRRSPALIKVVVSTWRTASDTDPPIPSRHGTERAQPPIEAAQSASPSSAGRRGPRPQSTNGWSLQLPDIVVIPHGVERPAGG